MKHMRRAWRKRDAVESYSGRTNEKSRMMVTPDHGTAPAERTATGAMPCDHWPPAQRAVNAGDASWRK